MSSIRLKGDGEFQLVFESVKALHGQFIAVFCRPVKSGIGSV